MDNVQFVIANSKNKHTRKATDSWLRTYERWAKANNETVEIHKLTSAIELNTLLDRFFANIKKLNGGEYEPVSLSALQAAIGRHLKEMGSPHDIFKDLAFSGSGGNAINILTHGFGCNIGFIFLVFFIFFVIWHSRYALVQITENKKSSKNKSYIAPEPMR